MGRGGMMLPEEDAAERCEASRPEKAGVAAFFDRLRGSFGDAFLAYLGLTYFGLKGISVMLTQSATLPYFQALKVSGTGYQLANVVAQIPWSMKGFMGVLSDCLPIGRYHKRGYLLLSSMVGVAAMSWLANLPIEQEGESAKWKVAVLFCWTNVMYATFDLLCEGKYSELMREDKSGSEVLTLVWGCVQLGSLIGALVVGAFVDSRGPQPMIGWCVPLAVIAAWRTARGDLPEEPARSWRSLRIKMLSEPGLFTLAGLMAAGGLALALSSALLEDDARLFVAVSVSGILIVYSFQVLPTMLAKSNLYMFLVSVAYLDLSGPLAYFYTGSSGCVENGPQFSYSYYLAVSNVVGSLGGTLGAVLFQYMQDWTFTAAFCITTLVQVVASAFDILIISRMNLAIGFSDSAAYLFGDAACQSIAAQMAIMPQAMLTARLCPRGAEATVFAILAGFQNFGAAVSSLFGVQIAAKFNIEAVSRDGPCDFGNLIPVVAISHMVIPLLCLTTTWFLVPGFKIADEAAFELMSPAPSFASPGPSPPASPDATPSWVKRDPEKAFEDIEDLDLGGPAYVMMEDHGDGEFIRLVSEEREERERVKRNRSWTS